MAPAAITAKFDHNWKVLGRRASPVLREAMAAMLKGEAADLRGALSPFRVTALSRVPAGAERSRVTASAGSGWPGDLGLGSGPVGLFARLRGRAHAAIKEVCGEPESVGAAQVSGRIARDAGRFTDMVINPLTSVMGAGVVGGGHGGGGGALLALVASALDAQGGLAGGPGAAAPPPTAHGLRVHHDRHVRRRSIYCVNRRNMVLGLGDGEISHSRDAGRFRLSVTCALDVSRASPGLAIDIVGPKGRAPARRGAKR